MEYTEVKIYVKTEDTERASNIAVMAVPYGIYIEDYRTLEQEAWEIANIDLIDEELLDEGNTTFIGKTHDQLVDFILKHETLWEDSMYLAIGYDGDVLVRKN
jgi:hypothetical protein